MDGGTYAEAKKVFIEDGHVTFFTHLGCNIKNHVADVLIHDKYPDYEIGDYGLSDMMTDAREAGFDPKEVNFLIRFGTETVREAIDTYRTKLEYHEKELSFKFRIAKRLKEIAKRLEGEQ